jgi:hypothetical protein
MKDQADTLRRLMRDRLSRFARPLRREPAIAVYLAPEARKARMFSPRELAMSTRGLGIGLRVRDESDPISDGGGAPEIRARLAVLSAEEADLMACFRLVRDRARREGVKKMDIVVCGVDGEGEGRRVFAKLFETCRRLSDVELAYVGTVPKGEKIRDSVAIRNFLIHCQGRQEA